MTGTTSDDRYDGFPDGFFARQDPTDDRRFYDMPRLVTHIDERAIAAVGSTYEELGVEGVVLDVASSWISHFRREPDTLVAQGMNPYELSRNEAASGAVVADLNRWPGLPFASESFDHAVCCVSVDYLVRPIEVFDDVARVVRPGGLFVHTFSNRCFPSKAIAGWLATDDASHLAIVSEYFRRATGWGEPTAAEVLSGVGGDPLWAVWATRLPLLM
jgi:hypothetical protein